jgi:hypothetical protein
MKTLYKTLTISGKNKEGLSCEDIDFGKIEIIRIAEQDAPLQFIVRKGKEQTRFRLFGVEYLTDRPCFPFSREDDAIYIKKQGRWGNKNLRMLYLQLIAKQNSFASAFSATYYIIGNTLYTSRCQKEELSITQTGNTIFGDWWSLIIERGCSNQHVPFSKKNYYEQLAKAKKFVAERSKSRLRTGKIHFSYPRISFVGMFD